MELPLRIMSPFAATQVSKPTDEQVFERACLVLWRSLLRDENIQRNGRRGQRQNGVDLYGVRNKDPKHLVGIQCKLKGPEQALSEKEVREEFAKALTFSPPLVEYFIVTTSPDDSGLQEIARTLAVALAQTGRQIAFHLWGWNTLEERISEHPDALNAFDPTHGAFAKRTLGQIEKIADSQNEMRAEISNGLSVILGKLENLGTTHLLAAPDDSGGKNTGADQALHAEIDGYRDLSNDGKPRTALGLLERLWTRVKDQASGHIRFRIRANIGSCYLALGDEKIAATYFLEAYEYAPTEAKAAANKMLALLLRHQWPEAIKFGKEILGADPTNEWVANYLLQAAKNDATIDNPLQFIPISILSSNLVQMGYAVFLRARHQIPDWWVAARTALLAKPDDDFSKQYCAEADLDEVTQDEQFQRTGILSIDQRGRTLQAAGVLRVSWEKLTHSEAPLTADAATTCCNFLASLRVLGHFDEATKVARQALEAKLDHPTLLTYVAAVALDGKDIELAERVVPRLPNSPDGLMTRFKYFVARGDWKEVAKFDAALIDQMPESERPTVVVGAKLASARLGPPEQIAATFEEIAKDVRLNPRGGILVADAAKSLGVEKVAEEAFEGAVQSINADSHGADRHMVAMYAAQLGRWDVVADILDGHVSESVDSDELHALATAFANDIPIRKRALNFFERLPRQLSESPYYLRAAGTVHFNRGDLSEAEQLLRKSLVADPNDVRTIITLFSTLQRRDRSADIRAVVDGLDLGKIKGPARQKILLAQVLQTTGRGLEALEYAYEVLRGVPNDSAALLAYFGLIISTNAGSLIPHEEVAAIDYWVRLEALDGEKFDFTIEATPGPNSERVFDPTHPIAALALGHRVGDTFEQALPAGLSKVWRITEIRHKFLHILHHGLEHFEARFPDSTGLYRVPVTEGDIQPLLDQVRAKSEQNRAWADLYLEQRVPLAIVAMRSGGNVLAFANYILTLGRHIMACIGSEPERRAALDLISHARGTGAVLDTYTVWVAAELRILDVLKAVFGYLLIPRTTIDDLLIIENEARNDGKESMSVGWHDGQFIRESNTGAQNEERAEHFRNRRLYIEENCQSQPITVPDEATELAKQVTDHFGAQALDAAYVGGNAQVLISDDLYFRHVANEVCGKRGVWLQAVLTFARNESLIDGERYAKAVAGLAARRHEYVAIDAPTLCGVFKTDDTAGLRMFAVTAEYIGSKNCDIGSHLSVVQHFLKWVWTLNETDNLRRSKATSIILENLIRFQTERWSTLLAAIFVPAPRALRTYLSQWIVGHFLSIEKVDEAIKLLAEPRR